VCLAVILAGSLGTPHFRASGNASSRQLAPPAAPLPANLHAAHDSRPARVSFRSPVPASGSNGRMAVSRRLLEIHPGSPNPIALREFPPLRRRPPPSFS